MDDDGVGLEKVTFRRLFQLIPDIIMTIGILGITYHRTQGRRQGSRSEDSQSRVTSVGVSTVGPSSAGDWLSMLGSSADSKDATGGSSSRSRNSAYVVDFSLLHTHGPDVEFGRTTFSGVSSPIHDVPVDKDKDNPPEPEEAENRNRRKDRNSAPTFSNTWKENVFSGSAEEGNLPRETSYD